MSTDEGAPNGGSQSFYRVTNAQIYERLETVKSKMDDSLRIQDEMLRDISEHSKRIRSLELRFYGVLAGLISAVAILAKVGGLI